MQSTLLFFHVLAATIWVGGHIILASRILPLSLARRDPRIVLDFEERYEPIGLGALLVQIISGIALAALRLSADGTMQFDTPVAKLVGVKVVLLVLTVALALQARLRHIPDLDEERLPILARHIVAVTILAVAFVAVGVALR